jgi:hypothetical protein
MAPRAVAVLSSVLLIAVAGCTPTYEVHTIAAPNVVVSRFQTFRILPVPPRRDGRASEGPYDPMVNNSITNRALRETVARAFAARGFVQDESRPDFLVAVYASACERLDVGLWDYGYPHAPRGRNLPSESLTTYTAGTVVVDVVSPMTRELWWRGTGTARLSEKPSADMKELQKAAAAIVKEFPAAASPAAVALRR